MRDPYKGIQEALNKAKTPREVMDELGKDQNDLDSQIQNRAGRARFRAGDVVRNKATSEEGTVSFVWEKQDGTVKYEIGGNREIWWDEQEIQFLRVGPVV